MNFGANDFLVAARSLKERLVARAPSQEAARKVDADTIRELEEAGIFRAFLPAEYGGAGLAPPESLAILEALGEGDGSSGWLAMVSATSALALSYLPADAAAALASELGPRMLAGVFAPSGMAEEVEGGYRVSGRWSFLSGADHAPYRVLGVVLGEGGKPALRGGAPVVRHLVVAKSNVAQLDTWDTSGLRATGSHDVAAKDLFVPRARVFSMIKTAPLLASKAASFPIFGYLAMGVAAVALGIARAAQSELGLLAATKKPAYSKRTLAEHDAVQIAFAESEAALRAARGFLFGEAGRVWARCEGGRELSLEDRVALRLAATHAVRTASAVTTRAYESAGGSAIYAKSPLQRHFRDVHVVTQHVMVAPSTFAACGKSLFGLELDAAMI